MDKFPSPDLVDAMTAAMASPSRTWFTFGGGRQGEKTFLRSFANGEVGGPKTVDVRHAAAWAKMREDIDRMFYPPLFMSFDEAAKLDLKPGAVNAIGLAARYWPAVSKDHPHMDDLTISPAPKGGYTVLNYDDDVLFAGGIGECCMFVSSHFSVLAQEKREKEEADRRAQRQAAAELAIRDRAAQEIARLKDDPGTAKLSAMADRLYGSSQDNDGRAENYDPNALRRYEEQREPRA